jgi:hypothetical protein
MKNPERRKKGDASSSDAYVAKFHDNNDSHGRSQCKF